MRRVAHNTTMSAGGRKRNKTQVTSDYKSTLTAVDDCVVALSHKKCTEVYVGASIGAEATHKPDLGFVDGKFVHEGMELIDKDGVDLVKAATIICNLVETLSTKHTFFSHPVIAIICFNRDMNTELAERLEERYRGKVCPCIIVTSHDVDGLSLARVPLSSYSKPQYMKMPKFPSSFTYHADAPWPTAHYAQDFMFNNTIVILSKGSKGVTSFDHKTAVFNFKSTVNGMLSPYRRQIEAGGSPDEDDSFIKSVRSDRIRLHPWVDRESPMAERDLSRELTLYVVSKAVSDFRSTGVNRFTAMEQVAEFTLNNVFCNPFDCQCRKKITCLRCCQKRAGMHVKFSDGGVTKRGIVVHVHERTHEETRESMVTVQVTGEKKNVSKKESELQFVDADGHEIHQPTRCCQDCPHRICGHDCPTLKRWSPNEHEVFGLLESVMVAMEDHPRPKDVPTSIVQMVVHGLAFLVLRFRRLYELMDRLSPRYRAIHDFHLISLLSDAPILHRTDALMPLSWVGQTTSNNVRLKDMQIKLPTRNDWFDYRCRETVAFFEAHPLMSEEQKLGVTEFGQNERREAMLFLFEAQDFPMLNDFFTYFFGKSTYANDMFSGKEAWNAAAEQNPAVKMIMFFAAVALDAEIDCYGTVASRDSYLKKMKGEFKQSSQKTMETQRAYAYRLMAASNQMLALDGDDPVVQLQYYEDPDSRLGLRSIQKKESEMDQFLRRGENLAIFEKVFRYYDPFETEYEYHAYDADGTTFDRKRKYCISKAKVIICEDDPCGPKECLLDPAVRSSMDSFLDEIVAACHDSSRALDFSRPARERFTIDNLNQKKLQWWHKAPSWKEGTDAKLCKMLDSRHVKLFGDTPHPQFSTSKSVELISRQRRDDGIKGGSAHVLYFKELCETAHNEPLARGLTVDALRKRLEDQHYYRYFYELYTDVCFMLDTEKAYIAALKESFRFEARRRLSALNALWKRLDAKFAAFGDMDDTRMAITEKTFHIVPDSQRLEERNHWNPWLKPRGSNGLPLVKTCYDTSRFTYETVNPSDVCSPREWFRNVGLTPMSRKIFMQPDGKVTGANPTFSKEVDSDKALTLMTAMMSRMYLRDEQGRYKDVYGVKQKKLALLQDQGSSAAVKGGGGAGRGGGAAAASGKGRGTAAASEGGPNTKKGSTTGDSSGKFITPEEYFKKLFKGQEEPFKGKIKSMTSSFFKGGEGRLLSKEFILHTEGKLEGKLEKKGELEEGKSLQDLYPEKVNTKGGYKIKKEFGNIMVYSFAEYCIARKKSWTTCIKQGFVRVVLKRGVCEEDFFIHNLNERNTFTDAAVIKKLKKAKAEASGSK